MSNLLQRVLIGLPIAVLVVALTWLGGWFFIAAVVVVMFILQREMRRLLDRAGFTTDLFFSYIIGLFLILLPFIPYKFEIGTVIFLLFIVLQVFKKRKGRVSELISTIFCGVYIPFGLLSLVFLRQTGSDEIGFFLTITFLLMIWGNDTFAYLGGRQWGRRLLAPDISPNKTWEGAILGLLGSAVGMGVAIAVLGGSSVHWVGLIPGVVIVSIFGPLGDLLESKLKRAAEIKDTSTILPGHGGFFDRLDGLVLAVPAFYIYVQLIGLSIITAV